MTLATPLVGKYEDDAVRPRVGILIGSLEAGGAQRMALALAHDLLGDNWEVRLLLLNPECEMALPGDAEMQEALQRRLTVLGGSSVRASTFSKCVHFPWLHRRLASAIADHRLDVVVSFMERANLLNLLGSRSVPRIISVREQISVALAEKTAFKRALILLAYPLLFRRASEIVLNAHGSAAEFARRFRLPTDRLNVIPNTVAPQVAQLAQKAVIGPEANALGPQTVLAAGRLVHAKAHAPLLRAFKRALVDCPDARLVIVGNGPLSDELGALADALGISDAVCFTGFQRNPYPWIAGAGVFALPSRGEGLPNALLEAMALGRACVAADCSSGPRELLAPDTSIGRVTDRLEITDAGLLVPPMPPEDLDAEVPLTVAEHVLADALTLLLRDQDLRQRLGRGARNRAAWFTPERAFGAWKTVIAESLCVED